MGTAAYSEDWGKVDETPEEAVETNKPSEEPPAEVAKPTEENQISE